MKESIRYFNANDEPVEASQATWGVKLVCDDKGRLLETVRFVAEEPREVVESFAESIAGISLAEAALPATVDGTRAPLRLHVRLISPGFGNPRDNHYYPADVLQRDAKVFEGVKMYPVDHDQKAKTAANEVGVIDKIVRFDKGAPVAEVTIFNPDFAEQVRNRAASGKLETLECSILASGRTRKGTVEGKSANIVEAITAAASVDWVTRAGAGGKALNIAESDHSQSDTGGEETVSEPSQTSEAAPATGDSAPAVLSEAEMTEALNVAQLPQVAKDRLKGKQFENRAALEAAIDEMASLLSAVTKSGQPLATGKKQRATAPAAPNLEELDQVNARWLGTPNRR